MLDSGFVQCAQTEDHAADAGAGLAAGQIRPIGGRIKTKKLKELEKTMDLSGKKNNIMQGECTGFQDPGSDLKIMT